MTNKINSYLPAICWCIKEYNTFDLTKLPKKEQDYFKSNENRINILLDAQINASNTLATKNIELYCFILKLFSLVSIETIDKAYLTVMEIAEKNETEKMYLNVSNYSLQARRVLILIQDITKDSSFSKNNLRIIENKLCITV